MVFQEKNVFISKGFFHSRDVEAVRGFGFCDSSAEGRCVQDYFFGTGLGEYGVNRFPGIFNKIFIIKNISFMFLHILVVGYI